MIVCKEHLTTSNIHMTIINQLIIELNFCWWFSKHFGSQIFSSRSSSKTLRRAAINQQKVIFKTLITLAFRVLFFDNKLDLKIITRTVPVAIFTCCWSKLEEAKKAVHLIDEFLVVIFMEKQLENIIKQR